MTPEKSKDLLISSDYPTDKIILTATGTTTVPPYANIPVNIAHNLPFIPLVMGNWTTSPTWDTTYEQGTGPIAPPNTYSPFLYNFTAESNITNVRAVLINNISGSTVTAYFRVYAFMPSDVNVAVNRTSISGDDLVFNTDYNYTKLWRADVASFPDTFSGEVTSTITHNFGYRPQVDFWVERDGVIQNIVQSTPNLYGIDIRIGVNSVGIVSKNSLACRVHWRIYIDE